MHHCGLFPQAEDPKNQEARAQLAKAKDLEKLSLHCTGEWFVASGESVVPQNSSSASWSLRAKAFDGDQLRKEQSKNSGDLFKGMIGTEHPGCRGRLACAAAMQTQYPKLILIGPSGVDMTQASQKPWLVFSWTRGCHILQK